MEEYAKVDVVSSLVVNQASSVNLCVTIVILAELSASCLPLGSHFVFPSASQAKRTLKAQKLQDELASGKLDQGVSERSRSQ